MLLVGDAILSFVENELSTNHLTAHAIIDGWLDIGAHTIDY